MANTMQIRNHIEPFVISWLCEQFDQVFGEQRVQLNTKKFHMADAVSADGTIVAEILSNGSAKTRGGRPNIGGLRKAENDFWRLANLADPRVKRRLLIFTSHEFMNAVSKLIGDPNALSVEFLHCPLTGELQKLIDAVVLDASAEQRSIADIK